MTWTPTVQNCDQYMDDRTGKYEYRAIRYRAAAQEMFRHGLDNTMTVVDVGAGMTEFAYTLMNEFNWRGRYIPVDGAVDGTDLNNWVPRRRAHWFVALEILEHLDRPYEVASLLKEHAHNGVVISTPNPETTDVLAMDPTHVVEVHRDRLEGLDFRVEEKYFYGGVFSNGAPDSLFGVWTK